MDYIFLIGLTGATILVLGSAWPDTPEKKPFLSIKNWLLAIGALFMFTYSLTGYLYQETTIFFIFLQILVILASIFMMLDTDDKMEAIIISLAGTGLIAWSIYLFEGYSTVIFIFGLIGVALGYCMTGGTKKRYLALTLGSILISIFSYIEKNWIFFWLNLFFAIFSAYYLAQKIRFHFSKQSHLPASKR